MPFASDTMIGRSPSCPRTCRATVCEAVVLHRQHDDIDVSDIARPVDDGDRARCGASASGSSNRVGGDAVPAQRLLGLAMAHDEHRG